MVAAVLEREVLGCRAPRIRCVPASGVSDARGREAVQVAESFGLRLDDWQVDTLVDACMTREDGRWAAFDVVGDVPRQNGKGGIIEARELAAITAWGERLVVHSSHEFATSMEAMLRMEDLLAETGLVKSVKRAHGEEGFLFRSGQRLRYRTRTKGGGRGFKIDDTLILDEAMILQEPFVGALLPTLSARSMQGNPQVWYMGSAVDQAVNEHGVVFARLRSRALAGGDDSLAFFSWSAADAFDADGNVITPDMVVDLIDDRAAWASANPALAVRISEEHVSNELRSMDDRTFIVERLGVGDWPNPETLGDSPVTVESWAALKDIESRVMDPVCLAFDVSPDRHGAIAAAGWRSDGLLHVEIVDHRPGTKWMPARIAELEGHGPHEIVCDGHGPVASVVEAVEEEGVTVRTLNAQEHAQACGQLVDIVAERQVRHLGSLELHKALKGARTRPLGDAWAWSRKNSTVDISPLVAATLALSAAAAMPQDADDVVIF